MAAVFIAIPHSGIEVPPEIRRHLLPHVDDRFLRSMSDPYTDLVYSLPSVRWERYRWSRFVADPNRGERQLDEGGVVPATCFDEQPLYPPEHALDADERERRVALYHRPYHERVAAAVSHPDTRFYLDGHSMAGQGPVRSPDSGQVRPDATLSNMGDREGNPAPGLAFLTCPPDLTRELADSLHRHLLGVPAPDVGPNHEVTGEVRINDPFPAGYGVRRHARPTKGVPGLQIELNQRLWVDEETWHVLPERVEWMRTVLAAWIVEIEDVVGQWRYAFRGAPIHL
jgi:N-formylglutamate deformylase